MNIKRLQKFLIDEGEDYRCPANILYYGEDTDFEENKLKYVDSRGEGGGAWVVFSVKQENETKFYKLLGAYSSHDGHYWDKYSLHEVVPEQKMITVYNKK